MINTEIYTKFILQHIPEIIGVSIQNDKGEKILSLPVKLNLTPYSTYFSFSYTFLEYENTDVLYISNKHSPRQIYDKLCSKLYTHINNTINLEDRDKIIEKYSILKNFKKNFSRDELNTKEFTSISELENYLKNK